MFFDTDWTIWTKLTAACHGRCLHIVTVSLARRISTEFIRELSMLIIVFSGIHLDSWGVLKTIYLSQLTSVLCCMLSYELLRSSILVQDCLVENKYLLTHETCFKITVLLIFSFCNICTVKLKLYNFLSQIEIIPTD